MVVRSKNAGVVLEGSLLHSMLTLEVCLCFIQLVLAIGDFNIPYRSPEIASRFRSLLVPGKIQHILCTGNLVSLDVEDYLRSLSSDVHIVCGDMDTVSRLLSCNIGTRPSRGLKV